MDLGLAGRVAMVTGGSQGIGKGIAFGLAREGVRVAICARTEAILRETAREIERETEGEVLPIRADVTSLPEVQRFVAGTLAHFGQIDILVNNASNSRSAGFFELTDEDWLDHIDVKLLGHIRMIREVAPHMMARRWGRIITMSGGAARQVRGADGKVFGWKAGPIHAGIVNLTKRLSDELGPYGITVNAIDPGGVWTEGRTMRPGHGTIAESRAEIRERQLREAAQREGISRDEIEARRLSEIPIRRRPRPDDAANLIVFVVSELAGAITGQVLATDGGAPHAVYY